MENNGWLFFRAESGTFSLLHSSGFYVGGFDSKIEAGVWLKSYLLSQQALEQQEARRAERERMRLLAQMAPLGKVS